MYFFTTLPSNVSTNSDCFNEQFHFMVLVGIHMFASTQPQMAAIAILTKQPKLHHTALSIDAHRDVKLHLLTSQPNTEQKMLELPVLTNVSNCLC